MKALTLSQPWASLVVLGHKHAETRGWHSWHRGPLAIHAGKGVAPLPNEAEFYAFCTRPPLYDALIRNGPYEDPEDIPRGGFVGVVDLVNCTPIRTREELTQDLLWTHGTMEVRGGAEIYLDKGPATNWMPADNELEYGLYDEGRYAWLLENPRFLPKIDARGMQGVWNCAQDHRGVPMGLNTRVRVVPGRPASLGSNHGEIVKMKTKEQGIEITVEWFDGSGRSIFWATDDATRIGEPGPTSPDLAVDPAYFNARPGYLATRTSPITKMTAEQMAKAWGG